MKTSLICHAVVTTFLCVGVAYSSTDSIGPNGIDSAGLGLTGAGIAIGQSEFGRPGKPGFDTLQGSKNDSIVPAEVFIGDNSIQTPQPNELFIDDHAEWVAGVMISTDNVDHDGDQDLPIGVATGASLFGNVQPRFGVVPTRGDGSQP